MSLEIRNLELIPPGETRHPIIVAPNMELPDGSIYHLSGPSGSGKSLFLKALAGLLPFQGFIRYKNMERDQFTTNQWRSMISYVGPIPAVFPGSIRENILIPFSFKIHASQPKPDDDDLSQLLDRIGLKKWDPGSPISKLSHGEKMRIQIIRHLLHGPDWLLLDEALSNLDDENKTRVLSILNWEINSKQVGVIVAQHHPLPEADHLLCIMNGKVHGPLSPN